MDPKTNNPESVPTFKKATIHEIFKKVWTIDKLRKPTEIDKPIPKINDEGLNLTIEYLRLMTIELLHRSNEFASKRKKTLKEKEEEEDDDDEMKKDNERNLMNDDDLNGLIEVRHLQAVAPGVLLDF